MTENQKPESWIGREVMVARVSSTEAELVNLEGISDWGVVCTYKGAEVSEPVLIPWGSLNWVRIAVPEEVGTVDNDSGDSGGQSEGDQLGE